MPISNLVHIYKDDDFLSETVYIIYWMLISTSPLLSIHDSDNHRNPPYMTRRNLPQS